MLSQGDKARTGTFRERAIRSHPHPPSPQSATGPTESLKTEDGEAARSPLQHPQHARSIPDSSLHPGPIHHPTTHHPPNPAQVKRPNLRFSNSAPASVLQTIKRIGNRPSTFDPPVITPASYKEQRERGLYFNITCKSRVTFFCERAKHGNDRL